jgi:prepilin-type N-terminal cleavage/methylation domain-containing protein
MRHESAHPAGTRRNRNCGFSLVEALVVVMIILVISAIAIPGFVQARMKANEASAVSSMRTIRAAEILYAQTYPETGFSKTLVALGPNGSACETSGPGNACIITDEDLANGFKSGYVFDLISDGQTPSVAYTLNGNPENTGLTGRCSFSTDQSGNITYSAPGSSTGGTPIKYSLSSGGSSCQQ